MNEPEASGGVNNLCTIAISPRNLFTGLCEQSARFLESADVAE